MAEVVEGLNELLAKLERLAMDAAPKAGAAAARAGMARIGRALRAAVMASSAPDAVKREARRTIAQRVRKGKGADRGLSIAKIGFGVGKTSQAQITKRAARRGTNKGVGLAKEDVHWFVLGTQNRYLKSASRFNAARRIGVRLRGIKARFMRHPTGRIQPYFRGAMARAIVASQDAALAAAREKLEQIIAKEASRQ
jgi:hypothetical protein